MDLTPVISPNNIRNDSFKQPLRSNQINWNITSFLDGQFCFLINIVVPVRNKLSLATTSNQYINPTQTIFALGSIAKRLDLQFLLCSFTQRVISSLFLPTDKLTQKYLQAAGYFFLFVFKSVAPCKTQSPSLLFAQGSGMYLLQGLDRTRQTSSRGRAPCLLLRHPLNMLPYLLS